MSQFTFSAVVEIHPNASHPIIILFVTQSESVSWNLKITHVNCQKMKPWKSKEQTIILNFFF